MFTMTAHTDTKLSISVLFWEFLSFQTFFQRGPGSDRLLTLLELLKDQRLMDPQWAGLGSTVGRLWAELWTVGRASVDARGAFS